MSGTGAIECIGDFTNHINDEGGVDGSICKNHHKKRDG